MLTLFGCMFGLAVLLVIRRAWIQDQQVRAYRATIAHLASRQAQIDNAEAMCWDRRTWIDINRASMDEWATTVDAFARQNESIH